ncbi:MAG TPA: DUF2341 domain-containing protein [Nannocystaceae bacterium]|nr:DUF2341 domain-containing protein [Nannocystaceae bacterium]
MVHRVLIALALALGVLASCYEAGHYRCAHDEQCIYSGAQGRCESIGYCSYGRDTCESGRVWGPYAGDGLAGDCLVSPDDGGATADGDEPDVAACEGWIPGEWRRRIPLQLVADERFADLADFPALVVLDPQRIDYDHAGRDGGDLQFADADGNPLPHEIDRWSSGDLSHVWVRLDRYAPADGPIYLYYDRPASSGDANATAPDVWRAGFASVWHLGNELADASGHDRALAANPTVAVSGTIGESSRFEADDDEGPRITAAERTGDLGSPFADETTVTMWVRALSGGTDFAAGTLFDASMVGAGVGGITATISEDLELCLVRGYNGIAEWCTMEDIVPAAASWHHLAIVMQTQPASVALYVDGMQRSTGTFGSADGLPAPVDTLPLYLGNDGSTFSPYAGDLDEVRLAGVKRSPAWIAAEFAAGTDALFEYGEEEHCQPQ